MLLGASVALGGSSLLAIHPDPLSTLDAVRPSPLMARGSGRGVVRLEDGGSEDEGGKAEIECFWVT
jgi:hypothetical protein